MSKTVFRKLAEIFNKKVNPPAAPRDNTVDIYHGMKVADPYRPLENLNADVTSNWTDDQNLRFQKFIAEADGKDEMRKFLQNVWNYESESIPARYGNMFFSTYNDGKSSQSIYRVRTSREGTPRTLIDPNKINADGTTALNGTYPSPDGRYVAYFLSENGSDETTLKIMDVETGENLKDEIKHCRFTSAYWHADSSGFRYGYQAEEPGNRFVEKEHILGQDPADDLIYFERPDVADSSVGSRRLKDANLNNTGHEYATSHSDTSYRANGCFFKRKGEKKFQLLFEDGKSSFYPCAYINGKIYAETDYDAPNGRLVAVDPDHPAPENWQDIIPEPEKGRNLDNVLIANNQIMAFYMCDTAEEAVVYDLQGQYKHTVPTPPQSLIGISKINKGDTHYVLTISGYLNGGDKYLYDVEQNTLTFWKPSACKANLRDAVMERIHVPSKDGTPIPMTIIRDKNTKRDGTAAVMLYGYGGFNVSLGPAFGFDSYAWVRQGGIYVQANLRGGGEFGADWYDQGRLHNKQNVFDDFAACAEYLIDKNYTSPERLVSSGGSNGGLLTLATMLQRPELFGAVISSVPVTDMYRFHKFTYGAAWKSDYGDIDNNKEDFNAAAAYSPLHNIKQGGKYPPTLVATSDHDDRVVPSHSYKFVATMQEKAPGSLCLLRVEKNAGHGAGLSRAKAIQSMVEEHAFIQKCIGPLHQDHYQNLLRNHVSDKPRSTKPKRG